MKDNFYISFGIWIAVLPFLGVPLAFKIILVTGSGIFLALVAAGPLILKKLHTTTKPKTQRKKIIKTSTKSSDKPDKNVDGMIVSSIALEDNNQKTEENKERNKNLDIRKSLV